VVFNWGQNTVKGQRHKCLNMPKTHSSTRAPTEFHLVLFVLVRPTFAFEIFVYLFRFKMYVYKYIYCVNNVLSEKPTSF